MDLAIVNEFLPEEAEQEKPEWRIKTDLDADWALDKIREEQAEYHRFEMVVNEKIEQLEASLQKKKEQSDRSVDFFTAKLKEYFDTVPHKTTKTQETYGLPSGKLVLKKQNPKFVMDDEQLTAWVEKNAPECLKIKKSTDWAGLKKAIKVAGDKAVDKNGEIVPGITVQERKSEFKVVL